MSSRPQLNATQSRWSIRHPLLIELMGDAELDIRPVTEAWDLGLAEKPADDPTVRYMAVFKADANYEAGRLPSPEVRAAVGRLIAEMQEAGVFVTAEALRPSVESKRIRIADEKQAVIDGPFAESKELIAGYLTLEVDSMAEALVWGQRYVQCLDTEELDVRPLFELLGQQQRRDAESAEDAMR